MVKRKLNIKEKLKKLKIGFPKLRKNKPNFEVPKQWITNTKGQVAIPKSVGKDMVALEIVHKRKFRLWGLKRFNQVLAGTLIAINFFISQAALMSMTPEIGLLFLANSYICIWGLWKSRSEREKLETFQQN